MIYETVQSLKSLSFFIIIYEHITIKRKPAMFLSHHTVSHPWPYTRPSLPHRSADCVSMRSMYFFIFALVGFSTFYGQMWWCKSARKRNSPVLLQDRVHNMQRKKKTT